MIVSSEAEPKGSDCYDQFSMMQECFSRYPTVYNKSGGPDDDDDQLSQAIEGSNAITTESDVDTVDQIEENNKKNSATSSGTQDSKTIEKKK